MEFITILIALAVEQYYKAVQQYRQFDWFASYTDWIRQKSESLISLFPSASGPIALILVLAPVLFVVSFLLNALDNLGVFFSFIATVALFIYSLGPRDISTDADKYTDALRQGDTEGALLHANKFFAGHQYNPEFGGSPIEIMELMKRGILLAFNNRILAVLCWFILLGPIGALMYRLTILLLERFAGGYIGTQDLQETDDSQSDFILAIQRLNMILGWIPARLCALTFALAGTFSETLLCWRCASDFLKENNEQLIINSGLKSLKMDTELSEQVDSLDVTDIDGSDVEQVLGLVRWSLVIVVTGIALMSIVGWIY